MERFFPDKHELIANALKEEKLKIVFKEGAEFVKERSEQIEKLQLVSMSSKDLLYDAVIIDCTDVCIEHALASSLFTEEFFRNLKVIMTEGAQFSQMLTLRDLEKEFYEKTMKAGFSNIRFKLTDTPEYGSQTPIGVATK